VNTTKTAPARRRHSVGGGGAPISYDRRRRRQKNVGGGGAQLYFSPAMGVHPLLLEWHGSVMTIGDAR